MPVRHAAPPRSPPYSAPLLQLLAGHAEGSGRECGQALHGDGVAAALAPAVTALVEALQRALDLVDPLEDAVGQRDLLLPFERLGTGVGLVVAGRIGEAVTLQLGDLRDGRVVLRLQLVAARGQ